jgi:hypothetical protein
MGMSKVNIFVRHIALPQDHGSWVFILSPLLIGLFAGDQAPVAVIFLITGALAAFLVRQPVTIAVKAYSGRRSRQDLPAARFWMVLYGLIGLISFAGLAWQGFGYLLYLAVPAVPVFALHLYLVSRRAERRQVTIELVGSGVLALAAPAGLWVTSGYAQPTGWWLFLLAWFQSAASIIYAYLRLEQREWRSTPAIVQRLRAAWRALLYTNFNLAAVLLLGLLNVLPPLLFVPYALQCVESWYGALHPAVGAKPTAIGFRQLAVSCLFTLLFILAYRIS